MQEKEGFLPIGDYKVWYKQVGGGDNTDQQIPLLTLHGGPGVPHNYLDNMTGFATDRRQVIFYDQLGCGNSDKPDNDELWNVDRFVEELGQVIKWFGFEKVHILGQSWGGMLAMSYALTQPGNIASLILANTVSDMHMWVAEANRLREDLPKDIQATLLKHEADGTTDSSEYQTAMMAFYDRHVCRVPMPEYVQYSLEHIGRPYYVMNGPSEFHVIGNFKDWSISSRLGEINLPTLIISGKYDESTPAINEVLHQGIPNSKWVMLENSSHLAHVEEPELYFATVNKFLDEVEQAN